MQSIGILWEALGQVVTILNDKLIALAEVAKQVVEILVK